MKLLNNSVSQRVQFGQNDNNLFKQIVSNQLQTNDLVNIQFGHKYISWTEEAGQLHEAISELNLDKVTEIIASGKVDPNFEFDEFKTTPLSLAVSETNVRPGLSVKKDTIYDIIKVILDAGADVNKRDSRGWSPLMSTANQGNLRTVNLLIDYGKADVNLTGNNGESAISMCALSDRNLKILYKLIDAGSSQENLNQALLSAVLTHFIDGVDTLLDAGAEASVQETPGITALDKAKQEKQSAIIAEIARKQDKIIQLLEKQLRQEQLKKEAVLTSAIESGNIAKVIDYVQTNGINTPNCLEDITPLMEAAHCGQTIIVKKLIEMNAEINHKSKYKQTALMLAVLGRSPSIVETLLEAGAEMNEMDAHGRTALDSAIFLEQTDSIKALKAYGAKMSAEIEPPENTSEIQFSADKNKEVNSDFFKVVREGDVERLEQFVEDGIDINQTDTNGNTALMLLAAYRPPKPKIEQLMALKPEKLQRLIQLAQQNKINEVQNMFAEVLAKLYQSAKENHLRIFLQLIDSGADISIKNNSGETALDIAITENKTNMIDILKQEKDRKEFEEAFVLTDEEQQEFWEAFRELERNDREED